MEEDTNQTEYYFLEKGEITEILDKPSPATTVSQPRLFPYDRLAQTEISLKDPSITFIEIGATFGFLLAESFHDNVAGDLHLENVTWVRCLPKVKWPHDEQPFVWRHFSEVALYQHATGMHVAQDVNTKKYFPTPSRIPYQVIFISKNRYEALHQQLSQQMINQFFRSVRDIVTDIPEFTFIGQVLQASPDYARADGVQLEYEFVEQISETDK